MVSRAGTLDWIIAALLVALALAVHGPLFSAGLVPSEEGYLVYGIERLAGGEVLYRDFSRNYAPAVYYFFLPLFEIFGHDLLVTRATWLAFLALLAGTTYLVARPFAPRGAAILTALVPILLPPPWHKMFVPLSVVGSLALCKLLVVGSPTRVRIFAVGVGLGAIGYFRQEALVYGLFIAAASVAAGSFVRDEGGLPPDRIARTFFGWVALGAGALLAWIPVIALFAYQDALLTMIDHVFLAGARANEGMELPFPALSAFFEFSPWKISLFYFPGVCAAAGAVVLARAALRRRFGTAERVLAQWTLMTVLMHSMIVFRSDLPHVLQMIVVPALVAAWLAGALWRLVRSESAARVRRVAAATLVPLSVWSIGVLEWGLVTQIVPAIVLAKLSEPLDEPGATIALPLQDVLFTKSMLEAIRERTRPGEPIFVAPYGPIYYFLSGRPNPTPYDVLVPGATTSPEVQAEIVQGLEESRVRLFLVMDMPLDRREERRFPRYAPLLQSYLKANFRLEGSVGAWRIYVRR